MTDEERYVLGCYRYIELNPVRANMVDHPATYPWSSYRANAQGEVSALLTPHPLYTELGGDNEERQIAYRGLFHEQLDPETVDQIRAATNGNFALGSSRFQAQVAATLGRRVTPGRSGRPRKKKEPASPRLFDEE
jgi:putative transposase